VRGGRKEERTSFLKKRNKKLCKMRVVEHKLRYAIDGKVVGTPYVKANRAFEIASGKAFFRVA
jgi:hypothetical protein